MGLVVQGKPFLDALTGQARQDVLAMGTERRFAAQEPLLRESDNGTHVLILIEGWAVVSTATDRASARLILALRGPGELVGEMAVLDGAPRSATVMALGLVRAVVITGDRFRRFIARNPQANGLLMTQLVARLRTSDDERRLLASMTVLQRVAARLLEFAGLPPNQPAPRRAGRPADGDAVLVDLSQHDLAAAVGATREAVAKALRLLRDARVVSTGQRRIHLVDQTVLGLLAAGGSTDLQHHTP
jgi:CRP/FNR family transcriptional regulator, cyclic AMP receptor protein